MSNVSIYEKNWMDLVFEGKNKAYGAYQLRQENGRTSLIALIGGITFFCGTIGLGLLLTSFGDAETVLPDDVIIKVDNYNYPPKKIEEPKKDILPPITEKEKKPTEKVTSKELIDPEIVKRTENPDDITKNVDLGKKNDDPNPNGGDTKGTTTTVNTGGNSPGTGKEGNGEGKDPDAVKKTNELDVLPEYPGGMGAFYKYVQRTFTQPDIEESGEITMSVIVSFVIEKDGTLTDIKAIRSSDRNMEKEAIRILRASKVKWSPGFKDGEPVRTLFMLPIKVKI